MVDRISKPKVSVILTSYNHARFIRGAIESVLNQTFTDFELIIWDDASSDNSWETINSYKDIRIEAYRNMQNLGGGNVNRALEIVSGEYIAVHHSDDVWEPDKLEKQIAFLDLHPGIGAVFTNALAIGENGTPLNNPDNFYSSVFDQSNRNRHEWLNHFFYRGNALCHPSVLIRKSCYTNCGHYRSGLAQLTDFDMWIRLCLHYEIHVLPEKLVRFRVLNNELNASGNRPETRIRGTYEFYKLLSNYRKLTLFDDLVKIFPSASRFYRNEETDMDFVLAMIAIEVKHLIFTLFGLDLLFEIISDTERSECVKRLYNFDHKRFTTLTAQHDVFSREEVATLWRTLSERDGQIASLNQAVAVQETRTTYLSQAVTERDGIVSSLNQAVAELGLQISFLNQAVADRETRITSLSRTVTEQGGLIAGLNQSLSERDGLVASLNQSITYLDQQIEGIFNTISWRITGPLRRLRKIERAFYGKWGSYFKNG